MIGGEGLVVRGMPVLGQDHGLEPILQSYVAKYQPDYPDIVAGFPSIEGAAGQFGVFRLDRT